MKRPKLWTKEEVDAMVAFYKEHQANAFYRGCDAAREEDMQIDPLDHAFYQDKTKELTELCARLEALVKKWRSGMRNDPWQEGRRSCAFELERVLKGG